MCPVANQINILKENGIQYCLNTFIRVYGSIIGGNNVKARSLVTSLILYFLKGISLRKLDFFLALSTSSPLFFFQYCYQS
jgi:hypothetical protein